jgi:CheY-like chemotaxis protein
MPSVLLVDDSAVARHALSRRLKAEGFDVLEAASTAAARAIPLSGLSCAIIDVDLLDGDGPSLASELRSVSPSLPVAFFTAGAPAELVGKAQQHGPVFTKPAIDPVIAWARSAIQPPPTK